MESSLKSDILRSFDEQDELSPENKKTKKPKQKKRPAVPSLNTNKLTHSISEPNKVIKALTSRTDGLENINEEERDDIESITSMDEDIQIDSGNTDEPTMHVIEKTKDQEIVKTKDWKNSTLPNIKSTLNHNFDKSVTTEVAELLARDGIHLTPDVNSKKINKISFTNQLEKPPS